MSEEVKELACYNEFRAQLAELKSFNESVVFDYEDDEGNKEARSHIYKLRKTKTAIDTARKAEKAESLEYGRQVDSQAKVITAEVEAMIEVHQAPIDEIEQREKERIAKHENATENIIHKGRRDPDATAEQLEMRLKELLGMELVDFEEYQHGADFEHRKAVASLKEQLERRQKYEAEQAELAELRQVIADQEQKDRDAKIAAEAEARAKAEAEKREAELIAQNEAAEKAAQEAQERAEREAAEREQKLVAEKKAAEKAAQEARETAEREVKEAEERRIFEAAEAEKKREANKRHVNKVNKKAVEAIQVGGIDEDTARLVVTLIADLKVPNVKIQY